MDIEPSLDHPPALRLDAPFPEIEGYPYLVAWTELVPTPDGLATHVVPHSWWKNGKYGGARHAAEHIELAVLRLVDGHCYFVWWV